ncbi:MAG: alkaline phosphatase [Smithellaceae bacterium]|nr:alkaline phosphatase [Smithellaceae bacterium]
MKAKEKKLAGTSTEISRRDLLKIAGAGALWGILPISGSTARASGFPSSGAQNLIFVVGDGMPLGVIKGMHETRTRFFGEKGTNFYTRLKDRTSVLGYMSTGSLSSIVTDSAPASVAWSTGSKTINRVLASLPDKRPLKTILELVKEQGYTTGLVTTARLTHATPAAWVSHQIQRDSEDAIALDYLKFRPEVLLGGGSRHFDPAKRKDKKDLYQAFAEAGYDVVKERGRLLAPGISSSARPLLGSFNDSHISYYLDRVNNQDLGRKEPSLPEMTEIALQKLSSNPRGFILQVEAGRIDHANHANDAWAAIQDTYELDLTLGVIDRFLKANPRTLVIVTSDHGTGGWGINGTGIEYNDSTEALKKYLPMTGSFEMIKKYLKRNSSAAEVRDIFEKYTSFRISDLEAAMIQQAMQPDYQPYPGDFIVQPDGIMGRILADSHYGKGGLPLLRRGNVGFTSTNHTAEDQILLAYGHRAQELGLGRHVDNTYLFSAMCDYFGIKYQNPAMTEEEAKAYLKVASARDWERHMELHIA